MTRFQIENTHSGIILGVYDAETREDALDALARDAGYEDYPSLDELFTAKAGEILVTELAARAGDR